MGIVDDFYDYLESEGLAGSSSDWPLVRRRVFDSPQTQNQRLVVLTEDGGFEPETPAPSGSMGDAALSEPAFQVRIRGEAWDSDSAHDKAMDIMGALHGLLNQTIGGQIYLRVKAQTAEPVFIGFDEKNRPEFTQSFRAVRRAQLVS